MCLLSVTHTSVRGEPGPAEWDCSECHHSTLAKEEWAPHRNSLSAEGLCTGRAASTATRISRWELKGIDISATHCKEKCQTTAETKPKEEQLKDQPENSLKPCQKSSLTTEQVRTAAVATAAANTRSTLEGRDSSFSPAPEGTSSGTDLC